VLYAVGGLHPRRYVNSFRGEPAITKFDEPFTPIHNSSPTFVTGVRAVFRG